MPAPNDPSKHDEWKRKISESRKGTKHTDEARRRMSVSHKGVPKSPEHRKIMAESARQRANSPFIRKKISDKLKGKPHIMTKKRPPVSDETREKQRKRMQGTKRSKESIDKQKASWTPEKKAEYRSRRVGIKASDETKQRQSISHKKRWTPELKLQQSNLRKGIPISEPHRKNIEKANRLKAKDPTICKKISEKTKGKKRSEEMKQSIRGEKNHAWKGGISFFPYCIKFDRRRKKATRDFFNNTCICCGSHINELPKNLSVHHIDHDKEQGCNGKPFNLVPLCHSCHSIENHYREEYATYINKTLEDGFKWGIWSSVQYMKEVMY
jgi:hypothetical protein